MDKGRVGSKGQRCERFKIPSRVKECLPSKLVQVWNKQEKGVDLKVVKAQTLKTQSPLLQP
jgi:hypothetical protein